VFIYLNETELQFRMNSFRIKAIKVCLFLAFTFHFCACAWYRLAFLGPRQSRRIQDLFSELRSSSWMGVLMKKEIASNYHQQINSVIYGYFSRINLQITQWKLKRLDKITMIIPTCTSSIHLLSPWNIGTFCHCITSVQQSPSLESETLQLQEITKLSSQYLWSLSLSLSWDILLEKSPSPLQVKSQPKCDTNIAFKSWKYNLSKSLLLFLNLCLIVLILSFLMFIQHHFQYLGLGETRIDEIKKYFMLLWVRCNGVCFTDLLRHLP